MTTEAEVFETLKYHVDVSPRTGTRRYYNSKGQLHREEGPAVVYSGGSCEWWQNGLRHRIDGSAVEWYDGYKEWWLNGVPYTEQQYLAKIIALGHTV